MKKLLILFALLPAILFGQIQLPLALQTPPAGTSHSEMMKFLKETVSRSKLFEMDFQAKTISGREIPVIFCPKRSQWKKGNTTALIFAQQHGNEPSGKEALLMLIYEIYLKLEPNNYQKLNLILVPMVNPDGNEAHQRRNGDKVDLNRNHVIVTEPETRLLHHLFEKYQPEITLDVHEYGAGTWLPQGFIKDLGVQLDCLSNPAIPTEFKRFAYIEILEPTVDSTRLKGVNANRYIITQSNLTDFVRHSTTDIDDGRNSFGIQYTLAFIVEGMNGFSKSDRIWQRAKHQLMLIKSFLNICHEKSDQIARFVRGIRQQFAAQMPDSIVIQSDYTAKFSRPLSVNLIRTSDLRDTTVVLPDYRPHPEPIVMVKRPLAYIIEKPTLQLIDLLKNHHLDFKVLDSTASYPVEQFEISGRDTLNFESRATIIPSGTYTETEKSFSRGDIIVPANNLRAIQIVQIFEPQSLYGLSHYEEYQFLVEGKVYPIYRLLDMNK